MEENDPNLSSEASSLLEGYTTSLNIDVNDVDNSESFRTSTSKVPTTDDQSANAVRIRPGGKKDPYRKLRILKQTVIFFVWLSFGLCDGIAAPTLRDLRNNLGVGTDDVSLVFVGQGIGYLIGVTSGGVMYRILSKRTDVIFYMSMIGTASIAFVPWKRSLKYAVFFFWTNGLSQGLLDIGGNSMVLRLWGEFAGTPLLFTHFGFGLGNFLAPQIARPFLSQSSRDEFLNNTFPSSISNDGIVQENVTNITEEQAYTFGVSYIIVSLIMLCVSTVYLYFVLKRAPPGFQTWQPSETIRQMLNPTSCGHGSLFYAVTLLVCLFIFFIHLGGAITSFNDFIMTFAIESQLQFSNEKAAALISTFWLCYMIGQLSGGFISIWVRIQILLFCSIIGAIISTVIMVTCAAQSAHVLWTCTCLYGLSVSLIFPTGIGWSNIYLDMNSMSTMVLLLGFGLGKIPYQYTTGFMMEKYGPSSMLSVPTFCMSVLGTTYLLMQIFASCKQNRTNREVNKQTGKEVLSTSYGSTVIAVEEVY